VYKKCGNNWGREGQKSRMQVSTLDFTGEKKKSAWSKKPLKVKRELHLIPEGYGKKKLKEKDTHMYPLFCGGGGAP